MKNLKGTTIAIDTETTGFSPYNTNNNPIPGGARIFCWAYMTEEGEWGVHRKTKKSLRFLNRLLNQSENTIVQLIKQHKKLKTKQEVIKDIISNQDLDKIKEHIIKQLR